MGGKCPPKNWGEIINLGKNYGENVHLVEEGYLKKNMLEKTKINLCKCLWVNLERDFFLML